MALSGSFNGSFSGTSGAYPRIEWSGSQNIVDNYTDVTVNVIFVKTTTWSYNNYGSAPNGAQCNININGDSNNAYHTFDTRYVSQQTVRSRTVRVYHNADGTKSCLLRASGSTNTGYGNYDFSQTVTLDTIPREAYLTNTPNFTVGDDPALTLWNGGNQYVQALLYVNGNLIKTTNLGQVTSATFTLDGSNDSAIYALMPSVTSIAGTFRIKTFSNSGYTTQIGGNKDKNITVSINTTTNKPTFTTASFANVAKDVEVRDSYNNLLVTSNTGTLLGSSAKMIKGYSKVRATVAVADKMVALNSATPDKYRFTSAAQQIEAAYSAVADVTLDLDNVTTNSFAVSAFDSRALSTAVNGSLSYMADYFNTSIFGLALLRDNNVDALTRLQFSGLFFNEYFGGGTSGVQNTVTIQYRYKETIVAWAAQSWTTITADAVITGNSIAFDEYVDGDLGVAGFDPEKSFDIQVRIYDKLSAMIIEGTLSRGIPLIHFTQAGIAFNNRYDPTEGGEVQIQGLNIFRALVPTGSVLPYAGATAPAGFLIADGSAISRTTYANLYNTIAPSKGTFTVTIASPNLVTLNSHGLLTGDAVFLTTTGALPTGLSQNTLYYVIYVSANTFRLASSRANAIAGTGINTSGSQSGTHTLRYCPFGLGDGSTTFNVPNLKGRVPVGYDNTQTEFKNLGVTGGAKTHTLTIGEMPSHTHTQNSHTHTTWIENNSSPGLASGGGWVTNGRGDDNVGSTTATNQNTGGGGAHNNLQPYNSLNFIIRY